MSPAGLAESDLDLIMGSISSHNIDYADLYFQYSKNEFWALEDGAVKNGSFSIDQGVGMRSIAGQKTAFTYSDEISMEALKDGVKIVKSINKDNESKRTSSTVGIVSSPEFGRKLGQCWPPD